MLFVLLSYIICLVYSDERELFNSIIAKYDKSVRPQSQEGYITNITIYPTLFYLLSINELEQTIRFSIDFTMIWYDPIIAWNPETKKTNRTTLKIPEFFVWQADISIFSSKSKTDLIDYNQRVVQVNNLGKIIKTGPQVVENPCDIEIYDFPFDHQECKFSLGPWSYINQEVQVFCPYSVFTQSPDFVGNTEWEFQDLLIKKNIETSYIEGDYDELIITIHLKRKSNFYVLAIIIPTFTCTTLCLFGFFLPSDVSNVRTEKATLGVSSLLAMSLILETVTANMPKSTKLPLLGFFVLFEIIICAVAMIVACIYSILHERATTREWVPSYSLRKLFLIRRYDRRIRQQDASFQSGEESRNHNVSEYIQIITKFMQSCISDEHMEDMWSRIFERIEILSLIFFQVVNIISTLVIMY